MGSVRLVVNAQTNAIAQRMRYDDSGRILEDPNAGFQPFGYAGGLYDPDTGLVRFGARDYDSEFGRWLAKDPKMFSGMQNNLMVYVDADPINRIDMTVRSWQSAHGAIAQVANVGPFEAMQANRDTEFPEDAMDKALDNGMTGPRNGDADACRHCVWSCAMALSIGPEQAQAVS